MAAHNGGTCAVAVTAAASLVVCNTIPTQPRATRVTMVDVHRTCVLLACIPPVNLVAHKRIIAVIMHRTLGSTIPTSGVRSGWSTTRMHRIHLATRMHRIHLANAWIMHGPCLTQSDS